MALSSRACRTTRAVAVLKPFSDARVRQTLRMMGHSPDDRVTQDIAREICQRQGLKALITGSIAALGSHYVLTLTAVNSQSGEVVASEQSEAENKEEVLKALTQAANKLREKLGESLNSIQRFDAPLEATTASLEALKAYTLHLTRRAVANGSRPLIFTNTLWNWIPTSLPATADWQCVTPILSTQIGG
jgi:hypothetical protein